MPVKPCANAPFVATQQFEVPFGTTLITLNRFVKIGGARWEMIICRRPVLPIWGVTGVAQGGATVYDFLPSTKANAATLVAIGVSSLQASINFVNDDILLPDQYTDGDYGDYLYNKIASAPCIKDRYIEMFNKANQFFRLHGAIVAFDLPLWKELTDLQANIQRQIDKAMMIAPGTYSFDTGSVANTALETWFAADATLSKLYGIELITT